MSVFLESLKNSGHLNRISMTICNVGSRKVASKDDYPSQGWDIFAPNLRIYGFDADADACDAANDDIERRQVNWTEKHIPLALGKSEGEATLYVTKDPMCCSLYPPNESYIARFTGLSELANLDFTVDIETTTLDDFCKREAIQEMDFLQLDVQGAELQVLQGAEELLNRSVLAVQVEVNFSDIYVNQPLFADVDKYLRSQGFTLFDIAAGRRVRKDSPIYSISRPGQLLWGDAFYFRDLISEEFDSDLKNPENILKLACIADLLNFPDYALELLEHLTVHQSNNETNYNFAHNIIEGFIKLSEILPSPIPDLPIFDRIQRFLSESDIHAVQNYQIPKILPSSLEAFHSEDYLRHNQRRQEHLSSLGLNLLNLTVLEVGAGIGDHTSFFLDRGCQVVVTEGRHKNLEIIRSRYPHLDVRHLDLDRPEPKTVSDLFEIVYCYGLLYHLKNPAQAIEYMSSHCQKMLLLETAVYFAEGDFLYLGTETAAHPTQSIYGQGCRPTRQWVFNQLKKYFDFVYLPITQPNHPDFPIDWTAPELSEKTFTRAVFIASREALNNPLLTEEIPVKQQRH